MTYSNITNAVSSGQQAIQLNSNARVKNLESWANFSTSANELLGKYKKMIRGDEDKQSFDGWLGELGDIMWYLMRICDVLDVSFYDVMIANVAKLNSRLHRDLIKGDGDDR